MMNKKKGLSALTLSMQNYGHGSFPRHEKMGLALKKNGLNVIWISPPGIKNKNFINIDLKGNFIPDFFFIGIYLKLFLTCICNIKKIKDIDYVFAIREYDAISIFFNPFFRQAKKILFSRGDVVSILKVNLPDRNFFQKLKDRFTLFIYPFLQKKIFQNSNLIIFQAKFLKKLFKKRINYRFDKVKILSNNCIIQPYKKGKFKKFLNKKIILGFAAPMYWSCKGLETILRIYKHLINQGISFKLEIAGSGPQAQKLRIALNKVSTKHYRWNGWVTNINNFFNKINILIVPSLYDSNPNLILEALQAKKIIFASNIAAHKEILKDDELLFSNNDLSFLISKFLKIKKSKNYKINLEKKIFQLKKIHTFDWEKKFYELVKKC